MPVGISRSTSIREQLLQEDDAQCIACTELLARAVQSASETARKTVENPPAASSARVIRLLYLSLSSCCKNAGSAACDGVEESLVVVVTCDRAICRSASGMAKAKRLLSRSILILSAAITPDGESVRSPTAGPWEACTSLHIDCPLYEAVRNPYERAVRSLSMERSCRQRVKCMWRPQSCPKPHRILSALIAASHADMRLARCSMFSFAKTASSRRTLFGLVRQTSASTCRTKAMMS